MFTSCAVADQNSNKSSPAPALWPLKPVPVSNTEAIIEVFWDPDFKAPERWNIIKAQSRKSTAQLEQFWDSVHLTWHQEKEDPGVSIERPYNLELADYSNLVLRINVSPGVFTSISATIDGVSHALLVNAEDEIEAQELECALPYGKKLERVTLSFAADKPGDHRVKLRWLMFAKSGTPWTPPPLEFDKYTLAPDNPLFEPGLDLVFNPDELDRMRTLYLSPLFQEVRQQDLAQAASQYAVDPATLLRPYTLYSSVFTRIRDRKYDDYNDGLILALTGLLTQNDDYMRQAAKHLIVQAKIEHWADSFMGRFPGSDWTHSAFAPNVATIRCALLLDWCWNWLTPEGRELVRNAIKQKGLPYLEEKRTAMANQGVRFHRGLVLGKLATTENPHSPQMQVTLREEVASMNRLLAPLIRPDGTYSEGMRYGLGTVASTFLVYHAAGRYLDQPISELVLPTISKSLEFVLDSWGDLPAPIAAFAAGPLHSPLFQPLCRPSSVLEDSDFNHREMSMYGLDWIWAPVLHPTAQPVRHSPFSVYPEGGWVFAGGEEPGMPRISLESGLWDGEGHGWKRKNAFTLEIDGKPLLITRTHVAYADARYPVTSRTAAFNTFTPGGRSQSVPIARDSLNRADDEEWSPPQRGAYLLFAHHLGITSMIASDAATAWENGVKKALRRVIFIRPDLVIIDDDVILESPETSVQSWNSFAPWGLVDDRTAETQPEGGQVIVKSLLPDDITLHAAEDAVHRDFAKKQIVPVYRAAFTSPSATTHRMLTFIEADKTKNNAAVTNVAPSVYEIRKGETTVRIAGGPCSSDALWGVTFDGKLGFAVKIREHLVEAGVFNATFLRYGDRKLAGNEFLYFVNAEKETSSLNSKGQP